VLRNIFRLATEKRHDSVITEVLFPRALEINNASQRNYGFD